jgi:O-antigen/teichoic acid export membrane protein
MLFEGAGKATISVALVAMGLGVRGAMSGFLAATLASLMYAVVRVRTHLGRERGELLLDYARLTRVFGGIAASTVAVTSLSYMDVVLVKHFFDPKTAGIYSAVCLAGKVLLFILGIIPNVLLPKATSHAARGESAIGLFLQALGVSVLISVCGLAVLALAPGFVITVMAGRAFFAAAPYLFEYGLAMALLGNTMVVAAFKIAIHEFGYVFGLLAVAVGEIVGIYMFHDSLWQVVHILLIGNVLALGQSLPIHSAFFRQNTPQCEDVG